jgi:hypothetical protein
VTSVGGLGASAGAENRAALAAFLRELQSILPTARADHPEWFASDLLEPLSDAWDEVVPSFEMAIRYLEEPPDANLLDAQLAHVGLGGKQAAVKLKGFADSALDLVNEGTKKAFGRVLGWGNILLGTLASVIPGAEAIKEMKEVHEQAAKDAESDDATAHAEAEPPGRPARVSRHFKL